MTMDEQSLNQALLSLETCEENQQINGINTPTTVSVAELPSDITDSLNVAAKQLSLLYGSVVSPTDEDDIDNLGEGEEEMNNSFAEPCLGHTTGRMKRILIQRKFNWKYFSSFINYREINDKKLFSTTKKTYHDQL